MDYNDIKYRIERTLISLNARFENNIENHTNYQFYEMEGEKRISITFGTTDEKKLINPIMIILHNLSNIKDNLKKSLKEKGYDPQVVEHEINNSLHLQILVDIVNQEKHGTPLNNCRSQKNPIIKNAFQSLRMGSAIRDDKGNRVSSKYELTMFIDANIKDDQENLLFSLDDLIDISFSKWNNIIEMYNLM